MTLSSRSAVLLTMMIALLFGNPATYAEPAAGTLSPQTLTSGKAQVVTLTRPSDTPAVKQIYLSPGGPVITQRWSLPHPGQDLARHDDMIYIAAGAAGLIIIDRLDHDNPVQARLSVGVPCNKISVSHQHAWLAARDGLYTVDLRDPKSPRTRAFINTTDPVTALASNDQYAALVQGREIRLFDSRHPGQLQVLATLQLDHNIEAIAIDHQQLYIAAGKHGVLRYQITAKQQLLASGHYRTTGPAIDIQVSNGIAAVATQEQGLTLLDVTDTQNLHWLGSHQQAGRVQQLQMNPDQNQVILLNDQQQLMLMDISNPGMPSMLTSLQLTEPLTSLQMRGNELIVLGNEQLQQLDFSATPPQYSNEGLDFGQGVNYGGERRVFIRDNIAYVADWFSGIHLYDISTPQQPRLLSTFHTNGSSKGIVVRDDYAYVADDDHGLQIINIHNPRRPFRVAELATPGLAYIPVLDGNRLYLAGHRGGFQIIDISNPEQPVLIGQHNTAGKTWAIRIRNNIAYIADDESGLMMFAVKDPDNIQLLGQFSPGGHAEDIILQDNIAYVAFFDRGLYIIDISDPGYPKKLGHLQTPGNARGIARNGRILYIADWLAGIQVIDVAIPSRPQLIGSYDTSGAAWGLALQNQFAFIMDWWGGLSVLDVSQPDTPTLAGRYHHRDHVHAISTQGKIAYAASGKAGLQIYDIKNPLNPTWMTGVDFDADATDVVTSNQRAYVALSNKHIAVIDTSNPFAATTLREVRSAYPIVDLTIQGPWLIVNHGHKGMTLYRIDGKYADRPGGKQRIKTAINNVTTFGKQSLAIARTDGFISIYANTGDRKPAQQIKQNADLLRSYQNYLIAYSADTGISIVDMDGNIISRITVEQPLLDIQTQNETLYLINDRHQLVVIDLTDIRQPLIEAHYQSLSPLTRLTVDNDTLYLSGNTAITALRPLPRTSWHRDPENTLRYNLNIPADMPAGSYHLNINAQRIDNGISIEIPKFSKPRFSMEDLNKALNKIRQQQAQP